MYSNRNFIGGLPHGELKMYYENGTLYSIQNFNKGKQNGLQNQYYENGKIARSYRREDDKLMEVIEQTEINGNKMDNGTVKNGNGILKVYTAEGKLEQQVTVKDGVFIQE